MSNSPNQGIDSNTTDASYINGLQAYGNGSTIYAKIDPAAARNIVTTLFLVINALIAIFGGYFLQRRNQRRLILRSGKQAKTVPFQLLTPWLNLPNCATYIWKTRTLPGGWLGLLMFASGVFGLVQHYTVNSYILPITLPTWCDFTQGLNTTLNEHELEPSSTWPAAVQVFAAQTSAGYTNGQVGIYNKVNSDTTDFQPTTRDVLGSWNCTQAPDSMIYPADLATSDTLRSYLDVQKFLNYSTLSISGAGNADDDSYSAFMAWSGIFDSSVQFSRWEIRASIANDLTGNTSLPVSNFKCSIVKYVPAWTPAPMPTNETLNGWKEIMFGYVYENSVEYYADQLRTVLNAMSMIAGSGNLDNRHLVEGAEIRYGCIVEGAKIDIAVYLIGTFLLTILFGIIVADFYQFIRYRMNKRKKLVENIPTDLISWQLEIVRKMTDHKELTTRDLKKYKYMLGDKDFEFLEKDVRCCLPPFPLW